MTEFDWLITIPVKQETGARLTVFKEFMASGQELENKGYKHGLYGGKCSIIDDPRDVGIEAPRDTSIGVCFATTYGDIPWLPDALKEINRNDIKAVKASPLHDANQKEIENLEWVYELY